MLKRRNAFDAEQQPIACVMLVSRTLRRSLIGQGHFERPADGDDNPLASRHDLDAFPPTSTHAVNTHMHQRESQPDSEHLPN